MSDDLLFDSQSTHTKELLGFIRQIFWVVDTGDTESTLIDLLEMAPKADFSEIIKRARYLLEAYLSPGWLTAARQSPLPGDNPTPRSDASRAFIIALIENVSELAAQLQHDMATEDALAPLIETGEAEVTADGDVVSVPEQQRLQNRSA